MSIQQLLLAGGGAKKKYIEDVFSTGGHYSTYTGTQTHQTGMNLTSDDGLTIFHRYLGSGVGNAAAFLDTFNRTDKKWSQWDANSSMQESANTNYWNGFNSSGVSIGPYWSSYHSSTNSWPANMCYNTSFKKHKGFFDLVEWTANGSQQTISHSLGTQPGFIMIKKLTGSTNQGRVFGYHRQMKANNKGWVKQTNHNDNSRNYVSATSSNFTVSVVNDGYVTAQENGAKYVAYIWADYDSADWGETGDQNIIRCGTYTGNGNSSPGQVVDIGWDPHWIIHFGYRGQGMYVMSQDLGIGTLGGEWLNDESCFRLIDLNFDGGAYKGTWPGHTSDWGSVYNGFSIIPGKGFQVRGNGNRLNKSGEKYYYVAVRKACQKPVENVSDYFQRLKWDGNHQSMRRISLNFSADMFWLSRRDGDDNQFSDRAGMKREYLDGTYSQNVNGRLDDRNNAAELVRYGGNYAPAYYLPKTLLFPATNVWNNNNDYYTAQAWKRNYGVLSQVNYYGTGGSQTLNHDLGVKPAMIMVYKSNNAAGANTKGMWCDSTYVSSMGDGVVAQPGSDAPNDTRNDFFGDGSGGWVASDTQFRVASVLNGSGDKMFQAYLFANIPGQVKFGQYTGNGSSAGDSQQINAGFSNGIQWVMIHKIAGGNGGNDRGGWIMADTIRGINNGSNSRDPIISTWGGGQQFSGDMHYGEAKGQGGQNSAFTNSGTWLETDVIDNNYSAGFVVKKAASYNYNSADQSFKWDINRSGWTYWYWAIAA